MTNQKRQQTASKDAMVRCTKHGVAAGMTVTVKPPPVGIDGPAKYVERTTLHCLVCFQELMMREVGDCDAVAAPDVRDMGPFGYVAKSMVLRSDGEPDPIDLQSLGFRARTR